MPDRASIPSVPVLSGLSPITLGEMDAVKLMNRTDTKYVTSASVLPALLREASAAGYRVLEVDGARICSYNSLYYDTDGLRMFTDHQNRKLTRQKVRTRVYLDSGLTFLEIKRKNNRGRTKKKRTEIPPSDFGDFRGNAAACAYLAEKSAYSAGEIAPVLETLFRRITLVNPAMTERMTIDTDLRFVNRRTGREATLRDAVVIERKQDGRAESPMKGILLDLRVKPLRMSKYCIGVTLTDPAAKSGRFKQKVKKIEKTINARLW